MAFQAQHSAYWLYRPSEACLSGAVVGVAGEVGVPASRFLEALPCLNLSTELNAAQKMLLPGQGFANVIVSAPA